MKRTQRKGKQKKRMARKTWGRRGRKRPKLERPRRKRPMEGPVWPQARARRLALIQAEHASCEWRDSSCVAVRDEAGLHRQTHSHANERRAWVLLHLRTASLFFHSRFRVQRVRMMGRSDTDGAKS